MRLVVVANYYPEHSGGVETASANLVRAYRQRGHTVRWLAADVTRPRHPSLTDDVPLAAWNVTERRLGFPWPIPTPAALARVRREVAGADAVHLHDSLYASSLAAALLSTRRPLLLTQHVGAVPYRSLALRALQWAAYRTAGAAVLGRADQVVFVNPTVRELFAGIRFRRPPQVIENPVDTDLFRPAAGGAGSVVLFAGRFVAKKGLELVRATAARTPDTGWRLVGRPDEVDPRRWRLANVEVGGEVAHQRMPEELRAARVLVLPSVGEGFPVIVQEALCCGTPAVVETSLAESAGQYGLIGAALEPGAIAAAIEEAASCSRARIAAEARARWGLDAAAGRYLELLEAIAP